MNAHAFRNLHSTVETQYDNHFGTRGCSVSESTVSNMSHNKYVSLSILSP